jgi:hypothetical protein
MGYEVANGRKGDGEGRGKLTGDEESTNNGPLVGVGRRWSRSGRVQPWCLGKKMNELGGWPSPWSRAKKRCRRWWRNLSATSSSDPPMNSGEIWWI